LVLSGAVHQQSGKLTEMGEGFEPPNFNGGCPRFWTKFLKLHLYSTFWAIKVTYWLSDLEH